MMQGRALWVGKGGEPPSARALGSYGLPKKLLRRDAKCPQAAARSKPAKDR